MQDLDKLRFPIGKFVRPETYTEEQMQEWIEIITLLPNELYDLMMDIPEEDDSILDQTYRPDGWTARQVIHHLADSHMNSFIRFKQALTQDNPTIMAYDENAWVRTPEIEHSPIDFSLMLLSGVHLRWSVLMEHMQEADWKRTFYHPEHQTSLELRFALAMYAWHSEHHLAHVKMALGA